MATHSPGGVTLLKVDGELCAEDALRFDSVLAEAVAVGARDLIVDLRGCSFVDGICAEALVEASRKLSGEGLRIVAEDRSPVTGAISALWAGDLPVYTTISGAVFGLLD